MEPDNKSPKLPHSCGAVMSELVFRSTRRIFWKKWLKIFGNNGQKYMSL